MGRTPGPVNSPRPIDIDILSMMIRYRIAWAGYSHPRLTERGLRTGAVRWIAPDFVHPATGKTIGQTLADLKVDTGDVVEYSNVRGEKCTKLSVEMDFDAAHALRGYQGQMWKVTRSPVQGCCRCQGNNSMKIGLAYDFTLLKKQLGEILADVTTIPILNDTAPLTGLTLHRKILPSQFYQNCRKNCWGCRLPLTALKCGNHPRVAWDIARLVLLCLRQKIGDGIHNRILDIALAAE